MIFLLAFFFLAGPIYAMEQLEQNLKDLQSSLATLNSILEKLETPIIPVTTWSINLDTSPKIINELVQFKTSKKTLSAIENIIQQNKEKINTLIFPSTPETQKVFKKQLANILYEYFAIFWSNEFNWCLCIPPSYRIAFIVNLIEQIKATHPNKNKRLVYTSLGTGGLLQDYLTIIELIKAGYKNIEVNLIDLIYPDVPFAPKEKLNVTQQTHETFLKQQPYPQKLKLFKEKLDEFAQKNNSSITITTYNRIEPYKYKAERNSEEKSDVLVMVDPGITVENFTIPPYPAETNIFGITLNDINPSTKEEDKPKSYFYIFIPRQGPAQLYSKFPKDEQEFKKKTGPEKIVIKLDFDYTREKIKKLINETSAKQGYKPKLIEELISKLNEIYYGTTKEELTSKLNKIYYGTTKEELTSKLNEIYYNPITKEYVYISRKIYYIADPHIAFQDLVLHTLSDNPVVYTLIHPDPTQSELQIKKIDPDEYKKADVVTPNSGAYFESRGFKKIDLET